MFKIIKDWSGLVALVALVVALLVPGTGSGTKLGNATASFQEADLGFYIGATPIALNTGASYPTVFAGDVITAAGGFSSSLATSTTLTPAQFCAVTNQQWNNIPATATDTLPSATSTYVACGSPSFGAINSFNQITNDSTNTLNIVAGTGMTFKCETQGVGTTTVIGGCTSSQVSIPSSSTAVFAGWWEASGTMFLDVGNSYH